MLLVCGKSILYLFLDETSLFHYQTCRFFWEADFKFSWLLYIYNCWDQEDYLAESYRQLSEHSTYTDIKKFNQKLMSDLTEKSNRIFKGLCNKKLITEKELKYFSFNFKNACCLGKIYLLLKIHKRCFDVPGRLG